MSDTIYCYPHSNVLMNKLKITEPEELQNAEIEMTSNYLYALQLQPIKGKFDFKHLCAIHKHIPITKTCWKRVLNPLTQAITQSWKTSFNGQSFQLPNILIYNKHYNLK